MVTEVLWWIFAAATVVAAMGVVFSRAITHSAIALILALGGVAAQYIFLQNPFLALVQVLIYGGAVAVLLLLALMVTRQAERGPGPQLTGAQWPFALVVGGLLAGLFVTAAIDVAWPGPVDESPPSVAIQAVSQSMFESYGAPFIIASALLLVALIGAIILGRTEVRE